MCTNLLRLAKVIDGHTRNLVSTAIQMDFAKTSRKVVGAAANSKKTFIRTGGTPPENPIIFLKPAFSIIVEGEDIIIPKVFQTVNHEVELGVIIDKPCKNVEPQDVPKYIRGYCLALDLTAGCEIKRAREKSLPWDLAKGFDTSTPVSRFINVSEIRDHNDISLWLTVNGEMRQQDSTSDLLTPPNELISFISKYMTLEPNDLILTGTPDGINSFKAGDVIECGMSDIVKMKFHVQDEL